jgi:hypothetical protein
MSSRKSQSRKGYTPKKKKMKPPKDCCPKRQQDAVFRKPEIMFREKPLRRILNWNYGIPSTKVHSQFNNMWRDMANIDSTRDFGDFYVKYFRKHLVNRKQIEKQIREEDPSISSIELLQKVDEELNTLDEKYKPRVYINGETVYYIPNVRGDLVLAMKTESTDMVTIDKATIFIGKTVDTRLGERIDPVGEQALERMESPPTIMPVYDD